MSGGWPAKLIAASLALLAVEGLVYMVAWLWWCRACTAANAVLGEALRAGGGQ